MHQFVPVASIPEQNHVPSSVSIELDAPFVSKDKIVAVVSP